MAKPQSEARTVGMAEANALHYVQCIAVSASTAGDLGLGGAAA